MSAFDQAWEVSKMGSVYRGGMDGGKPSYFALDPDVAVAYALGGHFGNTPRQAMSLYEHDDDRLDTEAIAQIMNEFYSHGIKPPENLANRAYENILEDWGANAMNDPEGEIQQLYNESGMEDPKKLVDFYNENLLGVNQIGDRPPALGRREIEFLQGGPVAMFLEPQSGHRYLNKLQQFMRGMSGPDEHEKDAGYAGGRQAKEEMLRRLIPDDQVGADIQRPMLEQSIRDMIANQQGVGAGNRNMGRQETEALRQQMRDAGYEWLAYMDRDPLNTLTFQHIGEEWPQVNRLWDIGEDDYEDIDMVNCEECGAQIPEMLGFVSDDYYGYRCNSCY